MKLGMRGRSEIVEGVRLLTIAESAHVRGDPDVTNWYLRAIAHLLVALVDAAVEQRSGTP